MARPALQGTVPFATHCNLLSVRFAGRLFVTLGTFSLLAPPSAMHVQSGAPLLAQTSEVKLLATSQLRNCLHLFLTATHRLEWQQPMQVSRLCAKPGILSTAQPVHVLKAQSRPRSRSHNAGQWVDPRYSTELLTSDLV